MSGFGAESGWLHPGLGSGGTGIRSSHRKLVPDMQGRTTQANLPEGNSTRLGHRDCGSESHQEPGAEKPHAGICAGAVG